MVAWFGLAGTVILLFVLALILFSMATQVSLSAWVSGVVGLWADWRILVERELNRWRQNRVRRRLAEHEAEEAWEETSVSRGVYREKEIEELEKLEAEEDELPVEEGESEDWEESGEEPGVLPWAPGAAEAAIERSEPIPPKTPLRQLELLEVEKEETPPPEAPSGEPYSPENYRFPPTSILAPSEPQDELTDDELRENARVLEQALLEFGVEARVVEIAPGPVITRFEVEPAPGVKVARILSLSNDLARVLRASRIRIVAPIPGKAAVGIEVPNRNPAIVALRDVIESEAFLASSSVLTIALGRTISGKPYVTDLAKMPHLLVAGATGSGKSVCLNTIIASILYKARPDQVQFVMIDPKRLELSMYSRLKDHHVTYLEGLGEAVVTTPANAISVLRAVEYEMERRYGVLSRAGVRNLEDYNDRVREGRVKADGEEEPQPLPYLVVIIDELADLMMTGAREVEEPIARLTQMSRAVGIHLVVATQRPSVDVITGVIKANFPARIAFQVSSKTDSRTILDMNGAEKLLGRGDMLFLPPGSPEPVRVHGAYISTEESEQIIDWIAAQPPFPKEPLVAFREQQGGSGAMFGANEQDPLFEDAARIVVLTQQGSISILQRKLKIGYARAARLIDALEDAGIVGPFDGSKAREVLVDQEGLMAMGIAPYGES
ncbi:MAG: DNA translocase FtsK [Calditrichaeota bacterium]|nr:DNA translocase FtsK [Calditrichota bacterium]